MNITTRVPRTVAADYLAYPRCIKTDEPAVDNVLIRWPADGLLRRMAPAVTAPSLGRPVSSLLLSTPAPQGEVSAVLLWSPGTGPQGLEVPVGPTVMRALRRLRVAALLSMVAAVVSVLLTGWVALALVPAAAYLTFRRFTLRRYWIRCRLAEQDQLELRDRGSPDTYRTDDQQGSSLTWTEHGWLFTVASRNGCGDTPAPKETMLRFARSLTVH